MLNKKKNLRIPLIVIIDRHKDYLKNIKPKFRL